MRSIKFRGKQIATGEMQGKWVYGDVIRSRDKVYINPHSNGITVNGHLGRLVVMHEVEPSTIGQYIGLKDGNKQEIYEGDIISQECECDSEYGCYHGPTHDIVVWDQETARFDFEALKKSVYSGELLEEYSEEWTLIGNRWDNPELLAPKEGADTE